MEKYQEPQIYVINNIEIKERLSHNYIVAYGNLGVTKIIEYNRDNKRFVNLDFDMIRNPHEYKVVIIDLKYTLEEMHCDADEEPSGNQYLYEISYPQKKFNPNPFMLNYLKSRLSPQSLKIVFAGRYYNEKYKFVKVIGQKQYSSPTEESYGIYDFINAEAIPKYGKKVISENGNLAHTIYKYAKAYDVIFKLPTMWDNESHKWITNPNYIPLLRNQDGEVISYLGYEKNSGFELLLPICEKKEELIECLLTSELPSLFPEFFPESKEFKWINDGEYLLKQVREIEEERLIVQEEYKSKIKALEEKRKTVENKYKFLNDLLIETGDKLVGAVCTYFKWLGFTDVEAIDQKENVLREDIQITDNEKLYIVEVKGIGGTSTDAECSQVAKHRRRREKEHQGKTIFPIYIVNHQRYIRPNLRQNPPFSDDQIDYALNDERGLLTTWQLYKQFILIENGIFSKDEVRESLDKPGIITLLPKNLVLVGKLNEYYKKPKAGIIMLNDIELKIGDEIYANKDDEWIRTKVVGLRLNGNDVTQVECGEVGLATDIELGVGFKIYIKYQ